MVHVHLALDHCNVAAFTFTMFWTILLLLLAQHFVFSAFLTATLLLPLCARTTLPFVILHFAMYIFLQVDSILFCHLQY